MKKKGLIVLSLFDGISCGRVALERAGVKIDKYYAAEIDKHAIAVSQNNYPDIIRLGDVTKVNGKDLPKIDLLMGGSPCQGFSFAGKRLNFEDPRSVLFFEFIRIWKETNPTWFLLENVRMDKRSEMVITKELGTYPLVINSNRVSAQNRVRLYWTNIGHDGFGDLFGTMHPAIKQPKHKHLVLDDIRQDNPDAKFYISVKAGERLVRHQNHHLGKEETSATINAGYGKQGGRDQQYITQEIPKKYYLSDKMVRYLLDNSEKMKEEGHGYRVGLRDMSDKAGSLTTREGRRMTSNFIQEVMYADYRTGEGLRPRKGGQSGTILSRGHADHTGVGMVIIRKKRPYQGDRQVSTDSKAYALSASGANNGGGGGQLLKLEDETVTVLRRLTPLECERLQTLPDNFTDCVSDSQRYKCIGNGWTVDVIVWIFMHLPKEVFRRGKKCA